MIVLQFFYSLFFWSTLFFILLILAVFPSHLLTKVLSKLLLFFTLVRVKVSGLENIPKGQAVLLAANHPGFIDFLVHYSLLPFRFRFVVAYTFFKAPIIRHYVKRMGYIPIGEEKRRKLVMSQSGAALFAALKNKEVIFVFPEGQRLKQPGEHIARLRTWAARVAQATDTTVVPIAVKGSEKILPKMRFLMRPGTVEVKIGQPITLEKELSAQAATEKLQQTIQDLYDSLR